MRPQVPALTLLLLTLLGGSASPAGKAPLIEITPHNHAYFFTTRGSGGEQRLVLVSRAGQALKLGEPVSDNRWFHAKLKPVAPGQRWELTVALDRAVPVGRQEGTVTITTGDPAQPRLAISARAVIDEVVSASPAEVYFGSLLPHSREGELGHKQILVTRRSGKGGFRVLGATSDLPFLTLEVTPQEPGKSYKVSIALVASKVPKGKIEGTITVRTNDPAFPQVRVPVRGTAL
jgi:hypothetical protein